MQLLCLMLDVCVADVLTFTAELWLGRWHLIAGRDLVEAWDNIFVEITAGLVWIGAKVRVTIIWRI